MCRPTKKKNTLETSLVSNAKHVAPNGASIWRSDVTWRMGTSCYPVTCQQAGGIEVRCRNWISFRFEAYKEKKKLLSGAGEERE